MGRQAISRAEHTQARPNVGRLSRPTSAPAFVDNQPDVVALRKLSAALHDSPHPAAQRELAKAMNNSPRVAAQRKLIGPMAAMTAQRQVGPEEEELLQGKFETAQRPAAAGRVAQLIDGDERDAALAYFDRRIMETGSPTSARARALRAQVIAAPTGAAANALVDQYVADWHTHIERESAEEVGQPDKVEEPDVEVVAAEGDKLLEENETANEESELLYHMLGASILAAAITWQTYRDRTGKQPGGRGAHALDELYTRIDEATNQLRERTLIVDQSTKIYQNPFKKGFFAGMDVMPMPVAERYAPWQEVLNMFYRVSFLMFAGRDELDDYQKRVKQFALKSTMVQEDPSASFSTGTMEDTMRVRSDLQIGFATGVGVSSLGLSYVPPLTSPVMYIQAPWDAFHVLNGLATRAEEARRNAELQQRRLMTYNMRLLQVYGRRQLSPTFKLAKFVSFLKLFKK